MIEFILFLAKLEKKVIELDITKSDKPIEEEAIVKEYKVLEKQKEAYSKTAPKASLGEKVKGFIYNIPNIARNSFDMTVGYGIAKYQNKKTTKHFKANPKSKAKIVYLMHGSFQNEGNQWRLAKQLKKEGYQALHLKGNHHLKKVKQSAKKAYEQIDKFQKEVKLKNPHNRKDYFSGHSSGANVGLYMSHSTKSWDYGLRGGVQARAPVTYGVKAKTLGQKLLVPLVSRDDTTKKGGKIEAVEMARGTPKVPVHVIAGKYDNLVPPEDTAYKKAAKHYIIDHKDSTHFGTSGANEGMNAIFIDKLKGKYQHRHKQPETKAA